MPPDFISRPGAVAPSPETGARTERTTLPEPIRRALDVAERSGSDPAHWRADSRAWQPSRTLAIGDPQAYIERVFEVLHAHGLLGREGWLAPDVQLISMGDHFDFGRADEREATAESGELLLGWLAAHPPQQVTLLTGNHDLGRVGELLPFSDDEFRKASNEANELYTQAKLGKRDSAAEQAFIARYPTLPSVEIAARDLASFKTSQRELVQRLLRERRLRLATHHNGWLLNHAGVTREHLRAIAVPERDQADPALVSAGLNAALDAAVKDWLRQPTTPFAIESLHRPGCAEDGEAGGVLLHRAEQPRAGHRQEGTPDLYARRYDARRIPHGLTQVVGHVRDPKSRSLLGTWSQDDAAPEGPLRSLVINSGMPRYAWGTEQLYEGATGMVFTDGAMAQTPPERYELVDLDAHKPHRATRTT
ncbi:MAG TPA: metallophosphoesterase [Polyangiaceae bacterium]|nr:metallophosphoesterase [Polyangiaceae bacterium]